MAVFDINPKEILGIGLAIERNGAAFYKALAGSVEHEEVKEIFKFLEAEEKQHIIDFNRIISELDHDDFKWGKESAYLNAVASTHIFADLKAGKKLAKDFENDLEVLFYAVGFEKDSIIFYEELKRFTRSSLAKEAVARLIQQEKEHVIKLYRIITEIKLKKKG